MSAEIAQLVVQAPRPKGLQRLVLVLLALNATDGGQLAFGAIEQARLAAQAAMDLNTRFSRIVQELQAEGYVSLDGGVLTVYAGGQQGAELSDPSQTSLLQPPTLEEHGGVRGGGATSQNARNESEVAQVLRFYAETFPQNSDKFGEDEKREVRAALKIRTAQQLKEAILGNKASAYHQGENEREKRYNRISHIFRPKQGKKTRAEVIDYFIEIYEKAKATTGTVKSGADPAIVKARKEEVRRAHRLRHDQEAQERGRRAVDWLAERGIKTVFRADGYPLWPEGG